jgi:hypothetical protein
MQGHDEGAEGPHFPQEAEVAVPAMPEDQDAKAEIKRRGARRKMSRTRGNNWTHKSGGHAAVAAFCGLIKNGRDYRRVSKFL